MPTKNCVEYRPVDGFPRYKVGSDGSVWSITSGTWTKLKATPNRFGYIIYGLCREGKVTYIRGHRLVLDAFVGECPKGMWARHLNGKAADNRLDNLTWDTPPANGQDRILHGTQTRGERTGTSKLCDRDVILIKQRILSGEPWYRIGKDYGVRVGAISCIAKDKTWTHIPWPNDMRPKTRDAILAPNAKLTERDVKDIKRRLNQSETVRSIAESHGVSIDAVYSIKYGVNWGWVTAS